MVSKLLELTLSQHKISQNKFKIYGQMRRGEGEEVYNVQSRIQNKMTTQITCTIIRDSIYI